jgi:hypothetical protein
LSSYSILSAVANSYKTSPNCRSRVFTYDSNFEIGYAYATTGGRKRIRKEIRMNPRLMRMSGREIRKRVNENANT